MPFIRRNGVLIHITGKTPADLNPKDRKDYLDSLDDLINFSKKFVKNHKEKGNC